MFTASRTGSPVCTQSGVTRCERCASYAAITRLTPTCSFPSAADQSAPSVSTGSSSASARPPDAFPDPPAHASPCLRVQARQRWPRHPGPAALSRPQEHSAHRPIHRNGARPVQGLLEGLTMAGAGSTAPHGRSSRSKKTTRHIVEITRPLAVGPCAACAPAARSQYRPPSSAGSACAWEAQAPGER